MRLFFNHLKTKFNSLFPNKGDKLLFFLVLISGFILFVGLLNRFTAEASEVDSTISIIGTTDPTMTVEQVSHVLYDGLNVNDPNYTWGDFLRDFSYSLVDTYFGVAPGLLSELEGAVAQTVSDWIIDFDTQSNIVKLRPGQRDQLRDIYERLGFSPGSSNIGYWRPLPVEYGNVRIYSNTPNVFITIASAGSGYGDRVLVALRGSDASATAIRLFIASGASSTVAQINTFYQGSNFSGYYKQISDASASNAVISLWNTNNYPLYLDSSISGSQDNALADFFGLESSSDPVWNGNLFFYDDDILQRLNTVPGSDGSRSVNRYQDLISNDVEPDDNLTNYFLPDYNIVFNPDFSVPIWLSVDPDPDNHKIIEPFDYDLPERFSVYEIDSDTSFYQSVINSLPFSFGFVDIYIYFPLGLGVAALILRRK